jgi:predicted DNA-binding transcriptional regulator AlpA
MANLSTREAAKKLGLPHSTLSLYIRLGKVPAPRSITSGGTTVHIWSEDEVEKVRKLLPKIANGRKTRWQKQRASEKKKLDKPKKKKPKKSNP